MNFFNGIGFNYSARQDIPTLVIDLFSFLNSSCSGLRLKLFVSSFKGSVQLKKFSRFELGSSSARLGVQNLSLAWARA